MRLPIDLEPVHSEILTVNSPRAATLIGTGKLAELAEIVKEGHAELVVVDHALSPVQQRNLREGAECQGARPHRSHP